MIALKTATKHCTRQRKSPLSRQRRMAWASPGHSFRRACGSNWKSVHFWAFTFNIFRLWLTTDFTASTQLVSAKQKLPQLCTKKRSSYLKCVFQPPLTYLTSLVTVWNACSWHFHSSTLLSRGKVLWQTEIT